MELRKLLENNRVVLLDGGMGTQLEQRGAPAGGLSNIKAPDTVVEVQNAYVSAGANALITNTFSMNRIYLEAQGMEGDVEEINRRGVELARKAGGDETAVLGDIGPTGQMLEPLGTWTEEQFCECFLEQARFLAEAGADAFIVETMMDVREALCAVRVCRENFELPVIASMTYSTDKDGGRTQMGNKAADCASELEAAGANFLGANCGDLDPGQMATIVKSYKSASSLGVLAQPNAGKPRLEGDETIYDMEPEPFAGGLKKCIDAGATLVGGCCGTSPDHIRAAAKMILSL